MAPCNSLMGLGSVGKKFDAGTTGARRCPLYTTGTPVLTTGILRNRRGSWWDRAGQPGHAPELPQGRDPGNLNLGKGESGREPTSSMNPPGLGIPLHLTAERG